MNVLAYLRVSTEEQARAGYGLDAQRSVIEAEAARRGWDLEYVVDDGYSAKDLNRPGIRRALDRLESGGGVLAVAKLDRLSRSLLDFASIMERARRQEWKLVALDLGVDMTTPSGQLMANVMASFAEYERQLISARTRDGLAASGKRLGRPRLLPTETLDRVVALREDGYSLRAIADELNRTGTPTAQGGWWHPSTVSRTLRSAALDKETAA